MTNPSAQTMLERAYELVDGLLGKIDRQTGDQKPDGDMPDDAEYHVMLRARDERNLNEAALLLKSLLDQADKSARAASAPAAVREIEAFRSNLKEAWAALAMIRETIETLGPVGALKASEHLDGPTFMHEAEELVAGIRALTTPEEASTAKTITLQFSEQELAVVQELADFHQLSQLQTMRQALRLYQLSDKRLREGETCVWSGDSQRVKDFAGDVPAAGEAVAWQPEATAPKTGKPFLAFFQDDDFSNETGIEVIWWEPSEQQFLWKDATPIPHRFNEWTLLPVRCAAPPTDQTDGEPQS